MTTLDIVDIEAMRLGKQRDLKETNTHDVGPPSLPQQVVPLTVEKIEILWKETQARMGIGGDPVLWFARAIERAHGIIEET